jgi:hypothetical protein
MDVGGHDHPYSYPEHGMTEASLYRWSWMPCGISALAKVLQPSDHGSTVANSTLCLLMWPALSAVHAFFTPQALDSIVLGSLALLSRMPSLA